MTLSSAASIRNAFLTALRPPPNVDVSEWAEKFRRLQAETAADAGRWDNSKTPYMVEVMRVLSPSHPAQRVVFQGPSRIGKTEAMNNTVGCYADVVRCPIMVVYPVEGDGEEWSTDHLDPMIQSTPRLKAIFAPDTKRVKGNKILHKRFRGGIITIVGANSSKSFRRRTARLLVCDEIDAYPGSLDGEGDPIALAEKRTSTFTYNRKIYLLSTPTVKDASRIETALGTSDERHYLVPCPDCGHFQRLVWGQVRWSETTPPQVDEEGRRLTEYVCVACAVFIPSHKKAWMVARGRWEATRESRVPGFQISALYSPWDPWAELVDEWLKAQGDPSQEQVFINTRLGETWDPSNAKEWDSDSLLALLEPLTHIPRVVACLTASVDVQRWGLAFWVDAWGPKEERWTVERRDFHGDPQQDPSDPNSVWAEAREALMGRYPLAGGGSIRISASCVDTGGEATQQAYKFCHGLRRYNVHPIKGDSGREGVRLWPEASKRRNKGKASPYMLGVFAGKQAVHGRLKHSALTRRQGQIGGPGYWHFRDTPALGPANFDELTSEVCAFVYSNAKRGEHASKRRRKWMKRSGDAKNESLDLAVYSYAALQSLLASGTVRLDKPAKPSDKPVTVTLGDEVVQVAPTRVEKIDISSRPKNLSNRDEISPAVPRPTQPALAVPPRRPVKKAANYF